MRDTDHRLHTGLSKMLRAYDGLLTVRDAATDQYNEQKSILDAQWQAELEPVLSDLYWWPFRNGVNEAPEDEDKLRKWLQRRFEDAAIIAVLLALLQRYHIRAANLGGQYALNMLGINAVFNLTNSVYLDELAQRAELLVEQGTDISLIDTTIDDLVQAVPVARVSSAGFLAALAAYVASRTRQRTETIERTERPFAVASATEWTAQNNGIRYKMYNINVNGCKKICEPWHGQVIRVGGPNSTIIPQHPGCDCVWSPIQFDGQVLGAPPVTVSVPGLQSWQPPAQIWTGGWFS